MLPKCNATGKAIFSSLLEAKCVMFNLKWSYKRNKDVNGNRVKHRQGAGEIVVRWGTGMFDESVPIDYDKAKFIFKEVDCSSELTP